MENIYFDNAATTKLDEEVLNEMLPFLKENYGNASSIYKIGREAKKAIEEAREKVAKVLNCNPTEIYFTAGGSESDNTAIKGIARAYKNRGNHIITSKIEHPAILETCKELEEEGFEVSYISVKENGIIDLEELKKEIKPTTILISVMFANNEIGTIEPIKEIENASGIGEVGNPICGDIMKMFIKVENNIITDVKFKTFGCGAAIATSSISTEMIKGKTIEEALKLKNGDVVKALDGLPPVKIHCSLLAEEAIHEAIADYYRRTREINRRRNKRKMQFKRA